MAVSFLFLGPSPLTGIKQYNDFWPIYVSMGTLGMFCAVSTVVGLERFTTYAKYGCPKTDPETLLTAVGLLLLMVVATGDCTGPVFSGFLTDLIGFSWTTTVIALVCLFMGTLLLVAFVIFGDNAIHCGTSNSNSKAVSEEEKALIGKNNEKNIQEYPSKQVEQEGNLHVLAAYNHPRQFLYRLMNRSNNVE